jgi:hypothetical protein
MPQIGVSLLYFLLKIRLRLVRLADLIIKKRPERDSCYHRDPRYHQSRPRFMPPAMRTIQRRSAQFLSTFWTIGERHAAEV